VTARLRREERIWIAEVAQRVPERAAGAGGQRRARVARAWTVGVRLLRRYGHVGPKRHEHFPAVSQHGMLKMPQVGQAVTTHPPPEDDPEDPEAPELEELEELDGVHVCAAHVSFCTVQF
jgi:hypothetical protein